MGNLVSKISYGIRFLVIQKLFGLIEFILWYIEFSLPYRMGKWILYLVMRQIFIKIRGLIWLITGVSFRRWRNFKPKNYHQSAHVQNIIGRYKVDPVLEASEQYNFVTTHNSFQHPQYVLQDSVTLYFITPKEAFFIETDPDIDVRSSDASSFMRLAQFQHAKKLISLPIESFHRIAQSIGDPQGQIIFLNNTTRCGSTVLVQMFEQCGHCMALSEPDALNAISFLSRRLPENVTLKLLQSVVRVLCKPYKGRRYESYLLKTTAPGIWSTPYMDKQYPDAKKLFMHRDGVKVADSLSKACIQMPLLRSVFVFSYYLGPVTPSYILWKFAEYFCNFPDHPGHSAPTTYCGCIYTWSQIMAKYLYYREQGFDIAGVQYEHLVSNPLDNMKIILQHCGLPTSWAEPAQKALSKDSQRNSPLSMKHLERLKPYAITYSSEHKWEFDLMCKDWCKIPYDAPNEWTPEGTITVEKGVDITLNGEKTLEPHVCKNGMNSFKW